ncbi:MAG: hypothetical protein HC880_11080 [Bacteroidia bacterium]|nr:hypothetical protein [Bacteroidia bacterium]
MPDKNFETLPGTGLEQLFQEMLRKEDYRVFEKFFNYFYNPLCSYALKFVSSSPLAEDIVSDVFFKIWKNRQKIVIQTSLQAYLFTAVKNQSLDYLKSKLSKDQPGDETIMLAQPNLDLRKISTSTTNC